MGHYLTASDIVQACEKADLESYSKAILLTVQAAANALATKLGVEVTEEAYNEPDETGLCAVFGPAPGKPDCPQEIMFYDAGSDWATTTRKKNGGR